MKKSSPGEVKEKKKRWPFLAFIIPVILTILGLEYNKRENAKNDILVGNMGVKDALELVSIDGYCMPFIEKCLFDKLNLRDLKIGKNGNVVRADGKKCGASKRHKLSGLKLPNVTLNGAKFWCLDMDGSDFSGADLRAMDQYITDFSSTNLFGSNFSGAKLFNVDFTDSDLRMVDFTSADLTRATLTITGKFPFITADGIDQSPCVSDINKQPTFPDEGPFKSMTLKVCERYTVEKK